MTKAKKEQKKVRRKRKKVPPLEDDAGIIAKATFQLKALTRKTAKKKKHVKKVTHPNPMQLGMTPSLVDGPSTGRDYMKILCTFFAPFMLSVLVALLWPPVHAGLTGPHAPFATGDEHRHAAVYNPKSTGSEYEKLNAYEVVVRRNQTYGRQAVRWNLGEYKYRNFQMVYVYAVVGRVVDPAWALAPANGTYTYQQHLKTTLVAKTSDGLGTLDLVKDDEVVRNVHCDGVAEWCRKVPVAMVSELNFPIYEARVRFSRPVRSALSADDAVPAWNETVPIKGYITFEYIPPAWLAFEFVVRYALNLASLAVFFRPRGLWASLRARPVDDWSASRAWCTWLFAAVFWFNEPLWGLMVWLPDQQDAFRALHATVTPGCVSLAMAHALWVLYAAKQPPPTPSALVMWVAEDQRKATWVDADAVRRAERRRALALKHGLPPPVKGMQQPPPTPALPGWQRPPAALLDTPLFYMKARRAGVAPEPPPVGEAGPMDMAEVAKEKRLAKKRKKTRALGPPGSEGDEDVSAGWFPRYPGRGPQGSVTVATDGVLWFARDCACVQLNKDWVGLDLPVPWRWRQGLGHLCIGGNALVLWLSAASLYAAQLSNGPVPRPRLTTVFAMAKHPTLAVPLFAGVSLHVALCWACTLDARLEISTVNAAYLCYYGVTHVVALLLQVGMLNCSFYQVGTPLMETLCLRTCVNAYAWVVVFMVQPLDDVGGRYPKREGMATAPAVASDEESSEEESSDEERPASSKKKAVDPLKVPSMGGGDDEDEDSDDEDSDDDDDDDDDDDEEGDSDDSAEGSAAGSRTSKASKASKANKALSAASSSPRSSAASSSGK